MAIPERPPPEPAKLLGYWMEWERGDTPPGRVMSNLKLGGLRVLLEQLVAAAPDTDAPVGVVGGAGGVAGSPPGRP